MLNPNFVNKTMISAEPKNRKIDKNNLRCAQIRPMLEFGSSLLSSPLYVQHFFACTRPSLSQRNKYFLMQAALDQQIKSIRAQTRRTQGSHGLLLRWFPEEASSDQTGCERGKGAPSSSHNSTMMSVFGVMCASKQPKTHFVGIVAVQPPIVANHEQSRQRR